MRAIRAHGPLLQVDGTYTAPSRRSSAILAAS